MSENIKVEDWCGYKIRFVNINGEWWAILKDICDALKLRTNDIAQRLNPEMLERVLVEASSVPSKNLRSNDSSNDLRSNHPSSGDRSNADSIGIRYDSTSLQGGSNDHKPVKHVTNDMIGKDIGRKPGDNKTRWMLAVNELGIYEALFASRRLEARKFRMWAGTVMQKLRSKVGLEQYEVMRMTEPEIQEEIDWLIDSVYWDEERGCLMRSVTVQGGDVEQVEFE